MIKVAYIDNTLIQNLEEAMGETLLDQYDPDIRPFLKAYLNDQPTVEVSTSGSTGKPKLIKIDKHKMAASAKATIDYFKLQPSQRVLLCLPTKFIAGKMIWVRALEGNLQVVVAQPSSNPIKDLDQRINFAAMTPHQVVVALDENPTKFDLIDQLIIGGGVVTPELLKRLQQLKTICYATFGMTETITHIAVQQLNGKNAKLYYEALGDTTFKKGAEDNLIICAPHLSEEDLVTNDIVEWVDSTHFKWLGRLDFVVNSGGVKLIPEQIEKKLSSIIEQNFFIWKEPDKKLGERLVLVIEGDKRDLPNFTKQLDKLEQPKTIYFIPEFVFTKTGKVDRSSSFLKIS